MQNFIPAHHDLAVLLHDLLQTLVEISLQVMIVLQVMLELEFLDFGVPVPGFSVHFISADVEVLVREQMGHLFDKAIQELIGFIAGGIDRRIEDPPFVLNLILSRFARQFGIGDKPTGGMAGHIELGQGVVHAPRVAETTTT